jgi:hypothetical protein
MTDRPKYCLNCRSNLVEEISFWYCPNRACWVYLGFIFHIPKGIGYCQSTINHLKEMWDLYEQEVSSSQERDNSSSVKTD